MIDFYHQKEIDMLTLGCTLPNLANICLHKTTDSKFYPFTESYKDFLEKNREDMVGGPPLSIHAKLWLTKLFPQINEFVQINCRHRRKPTLSLFDVSTNAYWILYKMGL